jgi:hypothetical protein
MTTQILYYTCNTHLPEIDELCRKQLVKSGVPIISVSLNKHLDFGNMSLTVEGERSPLMMHKQIVAGLKVSNADYIYLCESDVLYHPTHFAVFPVDVLDKDTFYYNTNVWKMKWPDKHFVWTDDMRQVSGVLASREVLLDFYTKRLAQIESEGFNRHYEPGIHQSVGSKKIVDWQSDYSNICIRHDSNITQSKWSPDEFRNKKYAKGWKEANYIEGWPDLK